MITEDQSEVVAFLSSPATYAGASVERLDTHASIVFLAADRARKLKRAVRYDYLDFSTAARRHAMCEAEVRINRRTAPRLYRGVVPVTRRADGALELGGAGSAVDWVVEMERFDQDALLDRLAERNTLSLPLMSPLGLAIARFHAAAEPRRDHGGAAGMTWVIDGNAAGVAEQGLDPADEAAWAALTEDAHAALQRTRDRIDTRRRDGFVRHCHGDLHLRNIVVLDGQPTLFDGVEFNDEIACVDVLYDLAFLLMDLWHRQLTGHASAVWNAYVAETVDIDDVGVLPLFLSCRAAIRSKTSLAAANLQSDEGRRDELVRVARDYLALAQQLLRPPPPRLVAIGGFSGSGKSTLARALAPHLGAVPGAVVIRSDEIRKRLCGVDPLARLGTEGYTPDVSARVYQEVTDRARTVVRGGHSAIVDAVCAGPAQRDAIEKTATTTGVPFFGLWLDAPEADLVARSVRRQRDASDADAEVVHGQLAQGAGEIGWYRLDASGDPEGVASHARGLIVRRG